MRGSAAATRAWTCNATRPGRPAAIGSTRRRSPAAFAPGSSRLARGAARPGHADGGRDRGAAPRGKRGHDPVARSRPPRCTPLPSSPPRGPDLPPGHLADRPINERLCEKSSAGRNLAQLEPALAPFTRSGQRNRVEEQAETTFHTASHKHSTAKRFTCPSRIPTHWPSVRSNRRGNLRFAWRPSVHAIVPLCLRPRYRSRERKTSRFVPHPAPV